MGLLTRSGEQVTNYQIWIKFFLVLSFLTLGESMQAQTLTEQTFKDIGGKETNLKKYKDHVVLIVNIATKCGYTPQLKGLESLYQKYKSKNLVVIGIPSNDFGGQTPENEEGVKEFCKLNYGVSFPLTTKLSVKGENKAAFIQTLLNATDDKKEISWNFEKFLINKKGQLVKRFASAVKPQDKELINEIESLL
jgi:glutathione peroxidase